MKPTALSLLFSVLLVLVLTAVFEAQAEPSSLELTPIETHHIAELNSNQPYVAGYDVITPDLLTLKPVSAVTITVCFESTDATCFPSDTWLGGGLFVQDQDSRFGFVDYGFYIILVLDESGDLFLDVGLHQTRESTSPIQGPTAELVYAYTWLISGIDTSMPVTLGASWDSEGFVHYSILAAGSNITLPRVDVAGRPNCENIHRQFWSGNWMPGWFPLSHFVYYFQFGVISSEIIADTRWSVKLGHPQLMKKPEGEWRSVDVAWSTQGDICYLDWDWMWGGTPYHGVSAHYYKNPLENPYEVIFFYNGDTLQPGTVLWQNPNIESKPTVSTSGFSQALSNERTAILSLVLIIPIVYAVVRVAPCGLRKKVARVRETNSQAI